jgi:hypothetical protein
MAELNSVERGLLGRLSEVGLDKDDETLDRDLRQCSVKGLEALATRAPPAWRYTLNVLIESTKNQERADAATERADAATEMVDFTGDLSAKRETCTARINRLCVLGGHPTQSTLFKDKSSGKKRSLSEVMNSSNGGLIKLPSPLSGDPTPSVKEWFKSSDGVDVALLVEDAVMKDEADQLMKTNLVFRPSAKGKDRPEFCRGSLATVLTNLRKCYAGESDTMEADDAEETGDAEETTKEGEVNETRDVHPICHTVTWLAWRHILELNVLTTLSSESTKSARTSFRSVLSHEGLAGLSGTDDPVLFMEGVNMVEQRGGTAASSDQSESGMRSASSTATNTVERAHSRWRSGERQEAARYPDAALMSWLPAGEKVPRCAWSGALLTFEFKCRLLPKAAYMDGCTSLENVPTGGRRLDCAVHEALRDASMRLLATDIIGDLPYHPVVISDGVFWIFGLVKLEDNHTFVFDKTSVRRFDDSAGLLADLVNIMTLSLLRPTYEPDVGYGRKPVALAGRNFYCQQWLGGHDETHVFLYKLTKSQSDNVSDERGPNEEDWVVVKTRAVGDSERCTAEDGALQCLQGVKGESKSWLSSFPWPADEGLRELLKSVKGFVAIYSAPVGIPLGAVCKCNSKVRGLVKKKLGAFKGALQRAQGGTPPFEYSFLDLHAGNLALLVRPDELQQMAECSSVLDVLQKLEDATAFVVDVESLTPFGDLPDMVLYRKDVTLGERIDKSTDIANLDNVVRSFQRPSMRYSNVAERYPEDKNAKNVPLFKAK